MFEKNQDKLLSLALEATSDGIWKWHIPSGEAYFSPQYYLMLGYEPLELPANYDTWASLLHPDDLEETQSVIEHHFQSRKNDYAYREKSGESAK